MAERAFTVALIGPDGAGKTTVARSLEQALAVPAKYIYMGVNWEASNHLLPTTRLMQSIRRGRESRPGSGGPPEPPASAAPRGALPKRMLRTAWAGVALSNRVAEEWYRQLLAWWYVRRGFVVIFDRHFFSDYHAQDIAARSRTLSRVIHGALLARVYPRPNLVVFLDAPAEVLHARKGEGTLESLEQRRHDYLALARSTPHFVTVDASHPLDEVIRSVATAIESFAATRSLPYDDRLP